MRWVLGLLVGLCLACANVREPEAPNVCPHLRSDDPDPSGYAEARAAVRDAFLGRTDLVVRCGAKRYPLHLDSGALDPKRFRPRGRCRKVLFGHEYGTLEHDDNEEDRCHDHSAIWDVRAEEDGRFTAKVRSISMGIELERGRDGRWTARATTCKDRPPVCAALMRGGCTVTASRP